MLFGTLPWTVSLLPALRRAWRSARERNPKDLFLLLWLLLPLTVFVFARSRMPLYPLPLFVPLALLAARRRRPALELTPRRRMAIATWIVFLVVLRGIASVVPQAKDARVLAQAIRSDVRSSIDEVVFVDTRPRYGLALYLDAEIEAVTLDPQPRISWVAELFHEELREDEGVRLFILPRGKAAAFHDRSRQLGAFAVACGGWRDLEFYQLSSIARR